MAQSGGRIVPVVHGGEMGASRKVLEGLFDMVDKDNKGYILVDELITLMEFQGIPANKPLVSLLVKDHQEHENTVEHPDHISRQEFCTIMTKHDNHAEHVQQLVEQFSPSRATSGIAYLSALGTPVWKQQNEHHHLKREKSLKLRRVGGEGISFKSGMSARMELGKTIDGTRAQMIVVALIIADIIIVSMEILLGSVMCLDPNAAHRRLLRLQDNFLYRALAGDPSGTSSATKMTVTMNNGTHVTMHQTTEVTADFCIACTALQMQVEYVLHWTSLTILFIFLAQIVLLMFAYGTHFFKNPFFLLDAVVVVTAVVLEMVFHVREGALFVVLLSWRVVRIVHGLYTTIEIQQKETHKQIHDGMADYIAKLKLAISDAEHTKEDLKQITETLARDEEEFSGSSIDILPLDIVRARLKAEIAMRQRLMKMMRTATWDAALLDTHIHQMQTGLSRD